MFTIATWKITMILITRKSRKRVPFLMASALWMVSATLSSQASEYSLGYSVEGGAEYNDNITLSPEDEIDVSGGSISLPATLTRSSERLESSLMGELTSSRYSKND